MGLNSLTYFRLQIFIALGSFYTRIESYRNHLRIYLALFAVIRSGTVVLFLYLLNLIKTILLINSYLSGTLTPSLTRRVQMSLM